MIRSVHRTLPGFDAVLDGREFSVALSQLISAHYSMITLHITSFLFAALTHSYRNTRTMESIFLHCSVFEDHFCRTNSFKSLADQAPASWWEKQQTEQNSISPPLPPHTDEATHHVVDIFQDVGEATDNNGELVLGDVDQTLLVVFCTDFTVGVLLSNFNGKLQEETRTNYQQNIHHSFNTSAFIHPSMQPDFPGLPVFQTS